jgi:hypothetical protein
MSTHRNGGRAKTDGEDEASIQAITRRWPIINSVKLAKFAVPAVGVALTGPISSMLPLGQLTPIYSILITTLTSFQLKQNVGNLLQVLSKEFPLSIGDVQPALSQIWGLIVDSPLSMQKANTIRFGQPLEDWESDDTEDEYEWVDDADDATEGVTMKPRMEAKKLPLIGTDGQEKRIQALDELSLLIDSCNNVSIEELNSVAAVLDDAQDDFELVGDDECATVASSSGWKAGT